MGDVIPGRWGDAAQARLDRANHIKAIREKVQRRIRERGPLFRSYGEPAFPVRVDAPGMRGLPADMPVGMDDGEMCGRVYGESGPCLGTLSYEPDRSGDRGCRCFISPPCSFCLSAMPECPNCGWRMEE